LFENEKLDLKTPNQVVEKYQEESTSWKNTIFSMSRTEEMDFAEKDEDEDEVHIIPQIESISKISFTDKPYMIIANKIKDSISIILFQQEKMLIELKEKEKELKEKRETLQNTKDQFKKALDNFDSKNEETLKCNLENIFNQRLISFAL
jgi:CHAT domain-containing protein